MRIAGIAVPPAGPPIFAAYPQSMENTGTRINKFLGDAGFCSRREADRLVEQGLVRVNGGPAHMGLRVFPSDRVEVSGQVVAGRKSLEYAQPIVGSQTMCSTSSIFPNESIPLDAWTR
jgi:23S rRNA pseudouridine2604 synthase